MTHPFYIVDVFAEEKYAGNQLAVIRGAADLSTESMQTIAREMNYSETTFILSDERRGGGYDVRIFTPAEEVPFAGHPTLGTAYIIHREIMPNAAAERVTLNLKVGQIPVSFKFRSDGLPDVLWMRQIPPTFGETVAAETAAAMLGLEAADIDARFPVQEVSTGLPALIVPLKSLDAVKRSQVNRQEYFALVETLQAKAVLVFCPETYHLQNTLNVRMFADYFNVPEDPATGSANGCLAAYLVKHRYFNKADIDLSVEQGFEMKRPSILYLRASMEEEAISVSVGGKVQMVAHGTLV